MNYHAYVGSQVCYEWSSDKKPDRVAGSGTPVEHGFTDYLKHDGAGIFPECPDLKGTQSVLLLTRMNPSGQWVHFPEQNTVHEQKR